MRPGDLVRPKLRMKVYTWALCKPHELDDSHYCMHSTKEFPREAMARPALVISDPGYLGAKSRALLLLTHDNKLRWAWSRRLKVL